MCAAAVPRQKCRLEHELRISCAVRAYGHGRATSRQKRAGRWQKKGRTLVLLWDKGPQTGVCVSGRQLGPSICPHTLDIHIQAGAGQVSGQCAQHCKRTVVSFQRRLRRERERRECSEDHKAGEHGVEVAWGRTVQVCGCGTTRIGRIARNLAV